MDLVLVALQQVIRTKSMHPMHIMHSGKQHNALSSVGTVGQALVVHPCFGVHTCTKRIICWCKCSVLVQGKVSPRARAGCESVWRVGVRWWPASGGGLPVEDTSGRTPGHKRQDTGRIFALVRWRPHGSPGKTSQGMQVGICLCGDDNHKFNHQLICSAAGQPSTIRLY